jgi:hypothetical protein
VNESKIELTERLRREGRWEEASRFKDETFKKLRSEGMTKADAKEESWRRMAAKYPPLDSIDESVTEAPNATIGEPLPAQEPRGTEHDIDIDALLDRIGDGRSSDLVRDTLWVYENLANRRIKASDAPSCGAWALLEWARQYRNRFFEQVLPKAMLNKPPENEENIRKEKKSIAEIEDILKQFNQDWAEDLVANVPKTVRADVRSILEDWARQFSLAIPNEAKADLEAHISRLIQDCIEVIGCTPGGVK